MTSPDGSTLKSVTNSAGRAVLSAREMWPVGVRDPTPSTTSYERSTSFGSGWSVMTRTSDRPSSYKPEHILETYMCDHNVPAHLCWDILQTHYPPPHVQCAFPFEALRLQREHLKLVCFRNDEELQARVRRQSAFERARYGGRRMKRADDAHIAHSVIREDQQGRGKPREAL